MLLQEEALSRLTDSWQGSVWWPAAFVRRSLPLPPLWPHMQALLPECAGELQSVVQTSRLHVVLVMQGTAASRRRAAELLVAFDEAWAAYLTQVRMMVASFHVTVAAGSCHRSKRKQGEVVHAITQCSFIVVLAADLEVTSCQGCQDNRA